jgi:hypothetical protein
MKLVAHRGHWLTPEEKNSFGAFERAWSGSFGIETDVRDLGGNVVISHDPPAKGAMEFERLLQARSALGPETPFALNIKADGLHTLIADLARRYRVKDYFVFDMSVPDTLHYLRTNIPVFLRLSEYERETPLLDRAAGVWLDAFEDEWWTLDIVRSLNARRKAVAIVSPELHHRPHQALWRRLKELEPEVQSNLMLCTDFPGKAEKFFA